MNRRVTLPRARRKYSLHKAQAKYRGIPFLLSFEEWYDWWLQNGVDKQLDTSYKKGDPNRLCMCRFKDQGAYELANIYLATHHQNLLDAGREGGIHRLKGKPRKRKSNDAEHKAVIKYYQDKWSNK